LSDLNDTLSGALQNPNVQNYLHMISSAEGTAQASNPYAVGFGGTQLSDLSQHPGTESTFTQTDGKQNTTSAAGAYQFEKGTWAGIQKALNLPDFGPQSQDMGAVYLMNQNGSLQDVENGDYQSALQKDGKTWASLPTSTAPQPTRSQAFVNQALGQSSGGGPIADASAADAPGANSADLSTVPAPKLMDAYQRASAAQDTQAMQQIQAALQPRFQSGLQQAQQAGDTASVQQIQSMMGQVGIQQPQSQAPAQAPTTPQAPQAAPQTPQATTPSPTPQQPVQAAPTQPQAAPAQPSTLDNIISVGKQFLQDPEAAGQALGEKTRQGIIDLAKQAVNDPLGTINGWVRGAADMATFGYADKLAAKADSAIQGTDYNANLAAQRQADQQAGPAFTAGQLTGAFLPGVGEASLAAHAADMVPSASRVVRTLAGATAGGAEGAANYMGHNDTDTVDPVSLALSTGLGAAGGTLPGLTTGATDAQKAATFLRANGGASDAPLIPRMWNYVTGQGTDAQVANAARTAEVSQGLNDLANRSSQNGAQLGPADANALAASYTQKAGDAVRQMDPSPQRTTLLNALDRSKGMTDDDIDALRTTPEGNAVADAIQMRQQAQALTAAQPANNNPILKLGRMAVNNGMLGFLTPHSAIGGFLSDLAPVRNVVTNLLGGRENRTANIAALQGQAENAGAFLSQYGPSANSQSAAQLQQIGQQALVNRQGLAAAQAAQNAQRQAAKIGPQITPAQWAANQQRQAAGIGPQITPMQRQQAAASVAAQAQQAQAAQVAQQNAAKLATQQRQALAETQSADPTYLLGMSNPNGAPRNAAEMSEFSNLIKNQMQAKQAAAQAQAAQAAAARAAAQPSTQALSAATRMPQGGGYQTLLQGGASGLNLTSQEANNGLRALANHPVLGPIANEMRQTGGVANEQQFYALQNGLRGLKQNGFIGSTPQAGQAAANVAQPSLADAMRLAAYNGGIANRQAAVKAAQKASSDPEVTKLITTLGTTTKAADRADLFNKFMEGGNTAQQIEAKRLAEPLVTYGKQ
jgi:muramidase (phage lysozyme)